MVNRKRIFVGPTEISGIYAQLVEGLNQVGLRAELVERNPHFFNYPSSNRVKSSLVETCRLLNKKAQERARSLGSPGATLVLRALAYALWLAWTPIAISRYSSFYFVFGHSLWPWNLDLPILRLLKKQTIMNLGHGSEARPPYLGGNMHLDARTKTGAKRLELESRRVKGTVQRAERFASVTIGNPFSTHYFATKRFVNWFYLGIPHAIPAHTGSELLDLVHGSEFKILHAPSKPQLKGTSKIIAAVEELRSEGLDVSLVLLTGVKNSVIRQSIEGVDLVLDQLYSDTPMSGLATEASAHGKPTIVAGYGLSGLRAYLPPGLAEATITCHPDQIKTTIRDTLISGIFREQGVKAQQYVKSNLSPAEMARKVNLIFEGNVPSEWWVYPDSISYLHGVAQTEAESKSQVRGMIDELGVDSLQLNHKPRLRDALKSWVA